MHQPIAHGHRRQVNKETKALRVKETAPSMEMFIILPMGMAKDMAPAQKTTNHNESNNSNDIVGMDKSQEATNSKCNNDHYMAGIGIQIRIINYWWT
jgi:hypothetical protein